LATTQQRHPQRAQTARTAVESGQRAVRVAPTGTIGFIEARTLEQRCLDLLDHGTARVVLDLSATDRLGPAALGTIAAIGRHARRRGSRFSVALGNEAVTRTLSRAGLLTQLEVEGTSHTFFDWTR
jgi:anti-sigma B factor antagonist